MEVVRKRAEGLGGGRLRTHLNFLSLITEGDESQNIRLYDGDVLTIGRSDEILHEQMLQAGQSNLSPQFIQVFVTGRVKGPGAVTVPQGSSLNQAITMAGGVELLKGKIEFVRFSRHGKIVRRIFSHKPDAAANTAKNPLLAAGDLIRVRNSPLGSGLGIFNETVAPIVSIYSLYSIFN